MVNPIYSILQHVRETDETRIISVSRIVFVSFAANSVRETEKLPILFVSHT